MEVIVVGAGPTGLSAAATLLTRGHGVTILDAQASGANTSRAAVVHANTLEVLERIGVTERLVQRGIHARVFSIRDRDRVLVPVRFDRLPTRYPYTLMISQADTEGILRDRVQELGAIVKWQHSVAAVEQDAAGVTVRLADGSSFRGSHLIAADGMHSTIRQGLGIDFRGSAYPESFSLADVRLSGGVPQDEVALYFSAAGMVVVAPLPGGTHRIVATSDTAPEQPDIAFVQSLLDARGPQQDRIIVQDTVWGSRFRVHHRLAATFHRGRILLAGDAAHVHSPAGGQGMNTGIQDGVAAGEAVSAALAAGTDAALVGYDRARRPVAEQVVGLADNLTRLATVSPAMRPVRNAILRGLSHLPLFRTRLAWRLSGLIFRPERDAEALPQG